MYVVAVKGWHQECGTYHGMVSTRNRTIVVEERQPCKGSRPRHDTAARNQMTSTLLRYGQRFVVVHLRGQSVESNKITIKVGAGKA